MSNTLPLLLTGTVLHGNGIGHTFRMPTANIIPDIDISDIERGVYYSKVYYAGVAYKGITNIGIRPTVSEGNKINAETFLYDFNGNLYDAEISVMLLEFRRPEQKFGSMDELRAAMQEDMIAGSLYEREEK